MRIYKKESLEKLKERIDLIEVLSPYIDLKRTGASYKGLCPFHDEKTPSFILQKGDRHYHCFGCGAHGDAIHFLMNYLKLSFSESVEQLAERFNIFLETVEKGEEKEERFNKQKLKELLEVAKQFYQVMLLESEEGKEALHYLLNRGLSHQFLTYFEVGYAPKIPGLLAKIMKEKGFNEELMQEAGLLDKQGRGREFFVERITFPIHNPLGAVIGFSARKYKEETFGGKYINSPESSLFKKSTTLFGLNFTRRRIAKERKAVIVEGQIDCLKLIERGLNITVASLGTAFGEAHVRELLNLNVRSVVVLFDGDSAGLQAASKVGDLFQKQGIEVRVATLPEGQDPDSYLKNHSLEELLTLLDQAKDYLLFQIDLLSKEINIQSPAGKTELVSALVKQIREWQPALMVHESLKKLAEHLNIPPEMIGLQKHSPPLFVRKTLSINPLSVDPHRVLELDLLRWLLLDAQKELRFFHLSKKNLKEEFFWVPTCRALFLKIMETMERGESIDFLNLLIDLNESDGQSCLQEILNKKINPERAEQHFIETIQKLLDREWLARREEVKMQIHQGQKTDEEILQLAKEFDELKKQSPKVET